MPCLLRCLFPEREWVRKERVMLGELGVSELRYRAVLEVLDGATVTAVARRFGVRVRRYTCGCAGTPRTVRC